MDMALKDTFPVLFGIACAKDAYVAAHMEFSRDAIQWNVSFARATHDWEADVVFSENEMGGKRQVVVSHFQ